MTTYTRLSLAWLIFVLVLCAIAIMGNTRKAYAAEYRVEFACVTDPMTITHSTLTLLVRACDGLSPVTVMYVCGNVGNELLRVPSARRVDVRACDAQGVIFAGGFES